jgi:hypothetical protein
MIYRFQVERIKPLNGLPWCFSVIFAANTKKTYIRSRLSLQLVVFYAMEDLNIISLWLIAEFFCVP